MYLRINYFSSPFVNELLVLEYTKRVVRVVMKIGS